MRWEYTTVQLVAAGFEHDAKYDDYMATMQQYGAEGWELVSAVTYRSPLAREDAVILFFKRQAATA